MELLNIQKFKVNFCVWFLIYRMQFVQNRNSSREITMGVPPTYKETILVFKIMFQHSKVINFQWALSKLINDPPKNKILDPPLVQITMKFCLSFSEGSPNIGACDRRTSAKGAKPPGIWGSVVSSPSRQRFPKYLT